MDSLKQNNIYEEVLGHTLGDETPPAPDVISEGFHALTWGAKAPLQQFNWMVKILQGRCNVPPFVGSTPLAQPQDTGTCRSSHTTDMLMSSTLVTSDIVQASTEDEHASNGPVKDPDDKEEAGFEDFEQAFEEAQPILSLQTADDGDLEMDADLYEQLGGFDDGVETDNSDDDMTEIF
jgi:hypothetical protein